MKKFVAQAIAHARSIVCGIGHETDTIADFVADKRAILGAARRVSQVLPWKNGCDNCDCSKICKLPPHYGHRESHATNRFACAPAYASGRTHQSSACASAPFTRTFINNWNYHIARKQWKKTLKQRLLRILQNRADLLRSTELIEQAVGACNEAMRRCYETRSGSITAQQVGRQALIPSGAGTRLQHCLFRAREIIRNSESSHKNK